MENNNIRMELNEELNGVELYFEDKPSQEILTTLKSNGYRWSGKKFCWYAKQSPKTLELAQSITNSQPLPTNTTTDQTTTNNTKSAKPQNKTLPLYNRVQFTAGTTTKDDYRYKFVGSNYTGLDTKETAKIIRTQLKTLFPEVKFSITSEYSSITINIKSSPYSKEKLNEADYEGYVPPYKYREFDNKHNPELMAIYKYCETLLNSYNYDDSDLQSDYHNSHFYDHITIDYQYTQTEQTETIKADIEAFREQLKLNEQAEEERKEQEYQERLKQQEIEAEENKKARIESARQIEIINNNVEVKPLTEHEQYFVIGSQFAKLNKNQTLNQYKEEIAEGENNYYLETVKVQKELHFTTQEALDYFSNHFLTDFDFLEHEGGSFTDDQRIQTMTDYNNMTKEERETVKFNLYGVAVYYNNELQFVIDPQGYSYARYVGLIDKNTKIEKTITAERIYTPEQLEDLKAQAETLADFSLEAITCEPQIITAWNAEDFTEYKTRMKQIFNKNYFKPTKQIIQQITEDMEELKVAMYRLLIEVDGIQNQFQNANLQQGKKYTMFYISDFGSMVTSKITFDRFECCKYAQYDKAVKIVFKPEHKRGLYSTTKYSELLVYPNWLDLPTEVLHTVKQTGTCTMTSSKYGSCDHRQYDEVINHFAQQGITPIINTYKPIFNISNRDNRVLTVQ